MTRLLVIDDEPLILDTFRLAFAAPDYETTTARTAREAVDRFHSIAPDVVISDIGLPDLTGLELFDRLHGIDPRVPVILMTGRGTSGTAIEAMRRGAFEYILKPLNLDTLVLLVESAAETSRLMRVPAHLPDDAASAETGDLLIGNSAAMQDVYRAVGRVAGQDVTVLIRGESGTGKEVIACAIYNYSQRSEKPFLAINCAAIPENLLESELFGHEKGSFTGADRKRIGRFEQCSGGTLFMDEIGDMTPLMQTKVLRVLQDQQFERVGGAETIRTDVRLVTATNCDLEAMMETREFRSDLFYRLNVYSIHLPPLRERGDDIRLLAEHFLLKFSRELNKGVGGLASETVDLLRAYRWPGNVRELQAVIRHALLEATGPVIVPAFLPESVRRKPSSDNPAEERSVSPDAPSADSISAGSAIDWDAFVAERVQAGSETVYDDALHLMEQRVISRVLQHTGGNQLQAAKILGVSRATIRSKLRQHSINIGTTIDAGDE